MFIKQFFTMFVQDKPIVSISVRIFMRTLFLIQYLLKLLSINVKMKSAAVVWCAEQNYVLKQIQWRKRRIFLRIWKIFDSVLLCFQEKWVSGRYSIENFVEISLPSKHLLVLKTSSRHVLKTSSTRLQCNNFVSSKKSSRRLQDVLEDEKLLRWRRLEDVLKMSWRHVLKTS